MEIIGAVKLGGQYSFFEAHYLYFVLDLDARLDESAEPCRPDLGVVTLKNAGEFVVFMQQFAVDASELQRDYDSLSPEDAAVARPNFFPTIEIDFDTEVFLSSHPDDVYLNFAGYLPAGWRFEHIDDVASGIPIEQAYWAQWSLMQ